MIRYNYIFIILLILVILISCFLSSSQEAFENINVDIGNYLCWYFYDIGLCILQKKNFNYDEDMNFMRNEKKYTDFIKFLPDQIIYNHDDIYNYYAEHDVTYEKLKDILPISSWFIRDDHFMHFWIGLKPLIHSILDNAFIQSNLVSTIDRPIIHFRCADTPFIKHSQYHFPKYEYYKNALSIIEQRTQQKYNSVYVFSCNTHLSDANMQKSCEEYTNLLCKYLESIGYTSIVRCGTNVEDISDLFYGPGVISTGSSFSFMSGFFGKGVFLSTEHIQEHENTRGCTIATDWMLPGRIKHSNVADYHNINEVENLLRS